MCFCVNILSYTAFGDTLGFIIFYEKKINKRLNLTTDEKLSVKYRFARTKLVQRKLIRKKNVFIKSISILNRYIT